MTDEKFTTGWKWECPHCGEINSVESDEYEDNQYGHEECSQCENFVRVEATVRIEFMAAAIPLKDVGLVKRSFSIGPEDVDDLQRLAESIDDHDVQDEAEALKVATETPIPPDEPEE